MNSYDHALAIKGEALALLDADLSQGLALAKTFGLTPAEIGVAHMIARGKNAKQAARALGLSHETVRNHLICAAQFLTAK